MLAKVCLSLTKQLRSNSLASPFRMNREHTNYATLVTDSLTCGVRTKTGMNKPDDLTVTFGKEQTFGFEVRSCEHRQFQTIDVGENSSPAASQGHIPQPHQRGRIGVTEWSNPQIHIYSPLTARGARWQSLIYSIASRGSVNREVASSVYRETVAVIVMKLLK